MTFLIALGEKLGKYSCFVGDGFRIDGINCGGLRACLKFILLYSYFYFWL